MQPRRWRRIRRLAVLGVFLALAAAAVFAFLRVGRWLVVEDPLAPADAIVVLSGRMPERAIEAARIYHDGASNEVWVSQPESPAGELAQLNIHYLGEDFYNQKVLLALGVPADSIRVLDEPAANTEAEVDYVADKVIGIVKKLRELSPLYEMAKEGVDVAAPDPVCVSSCAIPMTIPMTARIGGGIRATLWTSCAKSLDCSTPGPAFPCARSKNRLNPPAPVCL